MECEGQWVCRIYWNLLSVIQGKGLTIQYSSLDRASACIPDIALFLDCVWKNAGHVASCPGFLRQQDQVSLLGEPDRGQRTTSVAQTCNLLAITKTKLCALASNEKSLKTTMLLRQSWEHRRAPLGWIMAVELLKISTSVQSVCKYRVRFLFWTILGEWIVRSREKVIITWHDRIIWVAVPNSDDHGYWSGRMNICPKEPQKIEMWFYFLPLLRPELIPSSAHAITRNWLLVAHTRYKVAYHYHDLKPLINDRDCKFLAISPYLIAMEQYDQMLL